MVMKPRFATELLDAIAADAAASPRHEICGLLLGDDNTVLSHLPARNVAADPTAAFEIDPATLITAYRRQRAGGARILGCYHSHPSGSAEPSSRDAASAEPNGWLWLIVTPTDARLWRAVAHGCVHGRFDPVAFACASVRDPPRDDGLEEDADDRQPG
jgi:proteasome lid subunit RPN8/RPN11